MTIQPLIKPVRVTANRLSWCRKQPCILIGTVFRIRAVVVPHECQGAVEASHVRPEGHGGIGTKPSDFETLPKCRAAHDALHRLSRVAVEGMYGVDLDTLLAEHNARYFAESKPERKPRTVRTSRVTFDVTCEYCRKHHRYPHGLKATVLRGGVLRFWCDRKRAYCEVEL